MRSTPPPAKDWSFNYRFNDDDAYEEPSAASIAMLCKPTGLDSREFYYVDIDTIEVRWRLRDLDEDEVAQMQESLSERGLINPPLIHYDHGDDTPRPILVAGLYRLEAARRLGWRRILCRVVQAADIEIQLMEIDENIAHFDLSPAEKAIYMGRRYALYELKYGPAKARGAHAANAAMGNANAADKMAAAFTTATAGLTGEGERTIQREIARAKALGADLLKRVSGTSLDRGVELDALAEMPPDTRDELVERAVAGKRVSAAAALRKSVRAGSAASAAKTDEPAKSPGPTATVSEKPDWDLDALSGHSPDDRVDDTCVTLAKLQQDWLQATGHARVLFLNWVVAGWTSPEEPH